VNGRKKIAWFLLGFFGASFAGLVVKTKPASAQSASATQVAPLPSRRAMPQRRTPVPAPTVDDDDSLPPPATAIRRSATDVDNPDGTPIADEDGDDPARTALRRNADGQPANGTEQLLQQDGIVEVGEPLTAQRDGEPNLDADPRLRSDIDAFEKPAAGYDAVAFQIDDVDPILDRRPARLARFEPYDPIGIRKGTWIFFPETELSVGRTSNLFRSPVKEGAGFFEIQPTVRAVTNWRIHAIELKASAHNSFHPGFTGENDRAYSFEARSRYDFSKRTNIESLVSHARDQESRSSPDSLDAESMRPDYLTTRSAIALNHRFNRLSVQLRGAVADTDFQSVRNNDGSVSSNDEKDLLTRSAAIRATWEFKPTLFAFTEVSVNDHKYRVAPSDGISRDSTGQRFLTGVSFGNAGKTWRGEIGVGYGRQKQDDRRLIDVDGIILDANLGWRINELSSLLLLANTDFGSSVTTGQSGSVARLFGIEGRHAFQRHLIGTASLKQTTTTYGGIDLVEKETTGEVGLEYFLNRSTTVFGRFSHLMFDTNVGGGDYNVDTVRVGMRIRQ
jgi:hypothetical protein